MNERKAERIAKKLDERQARTDRSERMAAQRRAVGLLNNAKGVARVRQREDWELGPLAPRRAANPSYGAASREMFPDRELPLREKERRAQWCGGSRLLCIRKGDRVVVVEGRWQGKIGIVQKVNFERMEVDLGQVTMATYLVPTNYLDYSKTATFVHPAEIPISWVRLVHPLPDPETGTVRDTIIQQLVPTGVVRDQPTRTTLWKRVVPRLNAEIPWPRESDDEELAQKPAGEFHEHSDTDRRALEKRTYVPTLVRPPQPPGLVDELRGKYSRFRTRHEDDWVAKKEAREKRAAMWLDHANGVMRTPLQEKHIVEGLRRKLQGEPKLGVDMLERIGQVIARKQPRKLRSVEADILSKGTGPGAEVTREP